MPKQEFKGKDAYVYLRKKGVPEVAAKAMIANIAVESGYTFDANVKQKGKRNDPAYGLFQFDPRDDGLDKPYQKYLEDKEKTDSMESQLDFFVDSVYGDYKKGREWIGYGNVKKFKEAAATGDVEETTKTFSNKLLNPGVPHLERRVNAAKNIQQYIGTAEDEIQMDAKKASMPMQQDTVQGETLEQALQQVVPRQPQQVNPMAPGLPPQRTGYGL